MAEPIELDKFLLEDFGMAFTVTCNECGDEVSNVEELSTVTGFVKVAGDLVEEVDDDAVVMVVLHECGEDEDSDDDDDWDGEDDEDDED